MKLVKLLKLVQKVNKETNHDVSFTYIGTSKSVSVSIWKDGFDGIKEGEHLHFYTDWDDAKERREAMFTRLNKLLIEQVQ